MLREPTLISTKAEGGGVGIQVLSVRDARLVSTSGVDEVKDPLAYALSNALVDNPIDGAALELDGYLEVRTGSPTLMAVTGDARVEVEGKALPTWRAIPLPARSRVRVEAIGSVAYVSFKGLRADCSELKAGTVLRTHELDGRCDDLIARYVPSSLISEYLRVRTNGGSWSELLTRVLRHLELASEMARRGAKLIRVKIGKEVYDVWVEELG